MDTRTSAGHHGKLCFSSDHGSFLLVQTSWIHRSAAEAISPDVEIAQDMLLIAAAYVDHLALMSFGQMHSPELICMAIFARLLPLFANYARPGDPSRTDSLSKSFVNR